MGVYKKYRVCCYKRGKCFRDYDKKFYISAKNSLEADDFCWDYLQEHPQYDRVEYEFSPFGCE